MLEELRSPVRENIADDVLRASCVRVESPSDTALVLQLQSRLGAGEAAAIALAGQVRAELVLMDERRGRAECARRGLPTMGVLGLLSRAKLRGFVPAVAPLIDSLRTTGGFFDSDALRTRILTHCGESA